MKTHDTTGTGWLNGLKKKKNPRPHFMHRLKVKGWKKINQANGNQKRAGVAILISDKANFKSKTIKRDKKGHYILIKEFNKMT